MPRCWPATGEWRYQKRHRFPQARNPVPDRNKYGHGDGHESDTDTECKHRQRHRHKQRHRHGHRDAHRHVPRHARTHTYTHTHGQLEQEYECYSGLGSAPLPQTNPKPRANPHTRTTRPVHRYPITVALLPLRFLLLPNDYNHDCVYGND